MAHVTLEELYYVCDCCYGFPCTEQRVGHVCNRPADFRKVVGR